jgi:nucleoside-diphosphate-sugar epimerase
MGKVLVTGATGFVGSHLVRHLSERGYMVRGVSRKEVSPFPGISNYEHAKIEDVYSAKAWQPLLAGVDIVVHLIAKTHSSDSGDLKALPDYRHINVDITKALLDASSAAGVTRFIYLSSIKAVGEETPIDKPFTEESPCNPVDSYGISKREAEELILKYEGKIDTVIFRPPMIYGPGVKGNFLRLLKAVKKGVPLPLGSIQNARSILFVGNLTSAIEKVIENCPTGTGIYQIADGKALSTPGLLELMASAMETEFRVFPFPPSFLEQTASLFGKKEMVKKLTRSLVISTKRVEEGLGFVQLFPIDKGIKITSEWFVKSQNTGRKRGSKNVN